MNRWMDRLRTFNQDWNDLPRRLLWIALLIAGLFLSLLVFRYAAPFVFAGLFAWGIDPLVRRAVRVVNGGKLARATISGILVILFTVAALLVLSIIVGRVLEEAKRLAVALPGVANTASRDILAWIDGLNLEWNIFESSAEELLRKMITDAMAGLSALTTRVASTVAVGAWRAAALLPQAILFIVLTLMGAYYMSADKERILAFVKTLLPEKYRERSTLVKASILRAVLGQIRAALIMMLVIFALLSAGFLLMGQDYAILFALVIAALDALPVIGAGLFLIPMAIYGIVAGNTVLAVGTGLLYLATIVIRQLLEPRLIGRQLGLHPLATMMAMYAGLCVMGFLGMLVGPLMLLLCKVALTVDHDKAAALTVHRPIFHKRK
ncbi:sporulation integral membrane protein YtvI [Clostridia bacterium]|nr:sporulation integral membrane protein YtvI [Clostridia bacterium]